jgi:hypothetical protein
LHACRVIDGAAAKQLQAETEAKLAEVTVKGYQALAAQKLKEVCIKSNCIMCVTVLAFFFVLFPLKISSSVSAFTSSDHIQTV